MIAEIYHKTTNFQEDELTGNFFGTMRYIPFTRGINQIFRKYVISEDPYVQKVLNNIKEDSFKFEFWKRSDKGYGEIDGYLTVANVGIGVEVKYRSGLSGQNQLEREAAMIQEEWCRTGEKLLIFVADEEDANTVYQQNKMKPVFAEVHLGYITWQSILMGLDDVIIKTEYEGLMIKDLERLLIEKGFVAFKGFDISNVIVRGDISMTSGENIHNAFAVVFKTLQNIENLMIKCKAELDQKKYYMPTDRFMRYSSDRSWEGWIYWSFILIFQRRDDGAVMKNNWINGPVYAVEINVDSDTCDVPKLYIAKMDFGDTTNWSSGCSPANHTLFYNAIHKVGFYNEEVVNGEMKRILPMNEYEQMVSDSFWGFKKLIRCEYNLVDIKQDNYKKYIFETIEKLSTMQ